jgi:hypothetical protein
VHAAWWVTLLQPSPAAREQRKRKQENAVGNGEACENPVGLGAFQPQSDSAQRFPASEIAGQPSLAPYLRAALTNTQQGLT